MLLAVCALYGKKMNKAWSTTTTKRLVFVTLTVAPFLVLVASITYAIIAINGAIEAAVLIPFGVAWFYKDLGINGTIAAWMIPISYLGALIAATIATFSIRVRVKTVLLVVVCSIIATNYIGCSSMRDELSRARIGG